MTRRAPVKRVELQARIEIGIGSQSVPESPRRLHNIGETRNSTRVAGARKIAEHRGNDDLRDSARQMVGLNDKDGMSLRAGVGVRQQNPNATARQELWIELQFIVRDKVCGAPILFAFRSDVMPMEEIEYIIKPTGELEIRAQGIKGPDCEKATEGVRSKLGEVIDHERTAEFFEVPQGQAQSQRA